MTKVNASGWAGFDAEGRQQCLTCWRWQFPVIHSCAGLPQAGTTPPEGAEGGLYEHVARSYAPDRSKQVSRAGRSVLRSRPVVASSGEAE